MSQNGKEWPLWKCATLTTALCGVPLLPMIIILPAAGLVTLIALMGLYLGFVGLFGPGHVVEGAILVIILAVKLVIQKSINSQNFQPRFPFPFSLHSTGRILSAY